MTSDQAPSPRQLALPVALLVTIGLGPLLNHGYSAAGPELRESLVLTHGQYGLLATLIYGSAGFSSYFLGRLAWRLSTRQQLLMNGLGTAGALGIAAIGTLPALLIAATVGGASQAVANPVTNRVLATLARHDQRPLWMGVKQSGVQVSQLLAGVSVPIGIITLGWTGVAIALGVVALLATVWSVRTITDAQEVAGQGPRVVGKRPVAAPPSQTGHITVLILSAAAFLSGAAMQATNFSMVVFATDDLALGPVLGGAALSLAGALAVISRVAWSGPIRAGMRPEMALLLIGIGAIGGAASMTASAITGVSALFWLGVVLHGVAALSANTVLFTVLLNVVEPLGVAAGTATVTVGMYFGFASGPLAMGAIVDFLGGFVAGWAFVVLLHIGLTVLGLRLLARSALGPDAER